MTTMVSNRFRDNYTPPRGTVIPVNGREWLVYGWTGAAKGQQERRVFIGWERSKQAAKSKLANWIVIQENLEQITFERAKKASVYRAPA